MDPLLWALILLGFAGGVLSGVFGIGGGILVVPALLFGIPGTPFVVARGASLLSISLSTLVGILVHRSEGRVLVREGVLLSLSGVVGAYLSAHSTLALPDRVLRSAFGVFLVLVSFREILLSSKGSNLGGVRERRLPWKGAQRDLFFLGGGLVSGVLSGALGIGGGIVAVPLMVFAGIPVHLAVGTSLLPILFNGVAGVLPHLQGDVGGPILHLGIPLALGASVGSFVGSRIVGRISEPGLRFLWALLLLLAGISLVVGI